MATTLCCTADPTWGSTQMLLNVTVKNEDNANAEKYDVTISFPSTYQMGPQPFRAPVGSVRCDEPTVTAGMRSYRCTSTNSQNFFAVFNMITPNNEDPKKNARITLNTPQGLISECPIAAWCPDVGSSASNGGAGSALPTWGVTVIAVGCGTVLALAIFVFAKYKLRPQREARVGANANINPIPGGGNAGTLMDKVAAAQRERMGSEPPPTGAETLMQKMAEARRKSEAEKKETGPDGLPPGPGTLLERVAEAKKLRNQSVGDVSMHPNPSMQRQQSMPSSPMPSSKNADDKSERLRKSQTDNSRRERKPSTTSKVSTDNIATSKKNRRHSTDRRDNQPELSMRQKKASLDHMAIDTSATSRDRLASKSATSTGDFKNFEKSPRTSASISRSTYAIQQEHRDGQGGDDFYDKTVEIRGGASPRPRSGRSTSQKRTNEDDTLRARSGRSESQSRANDEDSGRTKSGRSQKRVDNAANEGSGSPAPKARKRQTEDEARGNTEDLPRSPATRARSRTRENEHDRNGERRRGSERKGSSRPRENDEERVGRSRSANRNDERSRSRTRNND
ncbi:hypothetical protein HDU67_001714 [Dinochytrium kinnereticum]|nr:hypothetical protein HDU67_001714 [Dinochytrium kinnereticum]